MNYSSGETSQTAGGDMMSPAMRPRRDQLFLGDLKADFLAGPKTATACPRLVTVKDSPFCSTSSRMPRHFALNSVALITLDFTMSF